MKPPRIACFALLFGLALTLLSRGLQRVQPSRDDLVGAWVGYERGCTYFYYLVLERGGDGKCEVLFADGTCDHYTVTRWRVFTNKMHIELAPATESAEEMKITVDFFDALSMDVTLAGVREQWKREATLYKESELMARIEKCRMYWGKRNVERQTRVGR